MEELLRPHLNLFYPSSCTDFVASDKDYVRDANGDTEVPGSSVTYKELQLLDRLMPLNCPGQYMLLSSCSAFL